MAFSRTKELQNEIRSKSKRNDIQNRQCIVCGDTKVENHHEIKVSRLVGFFIRHFKVKVEEVPIPTCDLCKPHHKKCDILYGDVKKTTKIDDKEYKGYKHMVEEIDSARYILDHDKDWVQDFEKIIDDTVKTVSFNLEKYHTKEAEDEWVISMNL